MKTADVCAAILNGELDDGIEMLYTALRERQKIARTIKAHTFKATVSMGQKVRILRIKPAYLKGQLATITNPHRGGNRVEIRLFHPIGKFGTTPMTCPVSCLEVVPDDTPVPPASIVAGRYGDDDGDMD